MGTRAKAASAISIHHHLEFGYEHARPTKDCLGGVLRAHRGVQRLRPFGSHVMPLHEIFPARYCTGYLERDIGVPAMDAPMDFLVGSRLISVASGTFSMPASIRHGSDEC